MSQQILDSTNRFANALINFNVANEQLVAARLTLAAAENAFAAAENEFIVADADLQNLRPTLASRQSVPTSLTGVVEPEPAVRVAVDSFAADTEPVVEQQVATDSFTADADAPFTADADSTFGAQVDIDSVGRTMIDEWGNKIEPAPQSDPLYDPMPDGPIAVDVVKRDPAPTGKKGSKASTVIADEDF